MASQTASGVRAAALRSQCLSLAKSFSIGFRSGEYLGSRKSRAPASRMARRTAALLREPRLSHDDDVARAQRRHEDPLDVEAEALAVDRAVEEPGGLDAVGAQGREKGHGLPVAVRHRGLQALTPRRPAPERRHVGLGPGLVDEDQAGGVDLALVPLPLCPAVRDVRPFLLGRDQRLFLCVSPSAWTNSHTVR